MDDGTSSVARRISSRCFKSNEHDEDLVEVLLWAVKNDQPVLRYIIKRVLLDKKATLTDYRDFVNLNNFELVAEALGLNENSEFWYNHLVYNIVRNKINEDSIEFFKLLMKYPYSDDQLFEIENICMDKFRTGLNEKLLSAMMENKSLPVQKEKSLLSFGWLKLLKGLIRENKFKLFRMIIADWSNFKIRSNLVVTDIPYLALDYNDLPYLSLLEAVSSAKYYDMMWLLSVRTWYFRLFQNVSIRGNKYVTELFRIIPELGGVPWDSPTFEPRVEYEKYIRALEANYENNVDAQVALLTTSHCPTDIKQYIMDAINNGQVNKVIAAAKANKLLSEHLHLVHGAGEKFKPAYQYIHDFLGPCDISNLQHGSHGQVLLIVLSRAFLFKRRALKLIEYVIPRMCRLSFMNVLFALDDVYALEKLEKEVFKELNRSTPELANAFLLDPAMIVEDQTALDLLFFYHDNGYKGFASELIMRSPVHRKFFLLESCLATRDFELISPVRDSLTKGKKILTEKQQRRLYGICSGLLHKAATNKGLAGYFVATGPIDLFFVMESLNQHDLRLFTLVLQKRTFEVDDYVDILKYICTFFHSSRENDGRDDMFEALFPFVRHLKSFYPVLLRALYDIFDIALTSGKTRIVRLMLENNFYVGSDIIGTLTLKRDFEMIWLILESSQRIDWSVNNNSLLAAAIGAGERDLVKVLLQYNDVFKGALQSDDALTMFPELLPLRDLPLKTAHRQYLKSANLL